MTENRRALVIGVNGYRSLNPLLWAANDAGKVTERLESVCQFSRKNICLLRDSGKADGMPTRENILQSLHTFADAEIWLDGGIFIFYFAGHGMTFAGRGYLAPIDTPDPTSEHFPTLSLPVDELRAMIEAIPARDKVILLDACRDSHGRSVGSAVAPATPEIYGAFRDMRPVARVGKPGAIGYLFACHEGQKSWELYDKQQSVFSGFLCESLSPKMADSYGEITFQAVAAQVDKEMEEWSKINRSLAHSPQIDGKGRPRIVLGNVAVRPSPGPEKSEPQPVEDVALLLEINANQRIAAGGMGTLDFRIKNLTSRIIPALDLVVDCPCDPSPRKTTALKNLEPSSIRKASSLRFEPGKSGRALLDIEVSFDDERHLPIVLQGQATIEVSSTNSSGIVIDIHDINKFMGNDLSGLLTIDRSEISEDRLRERLQRSEPLWMRVDLALDEEETERRRIKIRRILYLPERVTPVRAQKALLESLDPAMPCRLFLFSMPAARFGHHTLKNDVILRFLPDFHSDKRSLTISNEQFVARYDGRQCTMALAEKGHASLIMEGRPVKPKDHVPLTGDHACRIGTLDFGLQIYCNPSDEDPHWVRSLAEIRRADPVEDPYKSAKHDSVHFHRTTNAPEESYLWLFRKVDIGWGPAGLELGRTAKPLIRLSFWNNRFYLEPLESDENVKADNRLLQLGDIVCLGAETEISFGLHKFHWMLNPMQGSHG